MQNTVQKSKVLREEGLDYDDVLVVPKYSEVLSRSNVDTSVRLFGENWGPDYKLDIPLIASCMDTVCEDEMATAMAEMGGTGIIHRFCHRQEQAGYLMKTPADSLRGAAIGVTGNYFDRIETLLRVGIDYLVIDVAHADHVLVLDALSKIKSYYSKIPIMVGTIATADAAYRLINAGADALRCGVGSGSLCSTRLEAGCGVPQITVLINCFSVADNFDVPIFADGGIRFAGDVVKALAAGANGAICGSIFAGTDESPGRKMSVGYKSSKRTVKEYRGMASANAQGNNKNVEGIAELIDYKGSVKDVISSIMDGIRSGISYVGAKNVQEFYALSQFIKVTPTASHIQKTVL